MIHHGRALYYPYLEFRDTRWLKTAALYYEGIDRIVPPGYTPTDCSEVQELNAACRFIRAVDPGEAAKDITPAFLDFVRTHLADAGQRGIVLQKLQNKFNFDKTFTIQAGKTGNQLIEELPRLGFKLYPGADENQFVFDEVTGSLYMAFLANHLGILHHTPVITDDPLFQPLIHAIQQEGDASDRGHALATLAIQCAVPNPLQEIPIDALVRFRHTYADERNQFYEEINKLSDDLKNVTDPETLEAILQYKLKALTRRAGELEKIYKGNKINLLTGLFCLSAPVIVATAGPIAIAAGLIAVASGKAYSAYIDRRKARAGSPVAYLLSLRQLKPDDFVEDLRNKRLLL